jgi:hypothetical protein
VIRSFLRSLRLTLPPLWVVVVAVCAPALVEGLFVWLHYWIGATDAARELLRFRDGVAAAIMAAYGIFRAAAFHPLYRPKYREWLAISPWTAGRPLPLGPIHLVWQDVVLVGLALTCLHGTPLGRVWALAAFLIAYLVVLGHSFWFTGPWWMGYVIAAGLGLAVRLTNWPLVYLIVLAVAYAVSVAGRGMALRRFPWPESELFESISRQFNTSSPARRKVLLGWPYRQFAPLPPERRVRRRDGILGPLLGAWWVYALSSLCTDPKDQVAIPSALFFGTTLAALVGRAVIYTMQCWSPINLWGRIATRRWIIPGYDYVFVAPLCVLPVAAVGLAMAAFCGPRWAPITYPLASAAVLIVALNMGPSLGEWSLVGHHRIVPGGINDPQRVKL